MDTDNLRHYLKDGSVIIEMITILDGTSYLLPETVELKSNTSFLEVSSKSGHLYTIDLNDITTMYRYINLNGGSEVQFKGLMKKNKKEVPSERLKVVFSEELNREETEYVCLGRGKINANVFYIKKIS